MRGNIDYTEVIFDRINMNFDNIYVSSEALNEVAEIMAVQDEALLEIGQLFSDLVTGGVENGAVLSEKN